MLNNELQTAKERASSEALAVRYSRNLPALLATICLDLFVFGLILAALLSVAIKLLNPAKTGCELSCFASQLVLQESLNSRGVAGVPVEQIDALALDRIAQAQEEQLKIKAPECCISGPKTLMLLATGLFAVFLAHLCVVASAKSGLFRRSATLTTLSSLILAGLAYRYGGSASVVVLFLFLAFFVGFYGYKVGYRLRYR